MVSSVNDEDLPQPRLVKQLVGASPPIQTRTTRKLASGKKRVQDKKSAGMPSGSVSRKKAKAPQSVVSKRKKKGAVVSPAIVDVVFGKLQNSLPDVEEIRRKRENDAAKCGRIVRSVGAGSNQIPFSKTITTASEDNVLKKDMTADLPSQSPQCHANMTTTLLSAGVYKPALEAAMELPGESEDVEELSAVDRFLKQPNQQNWSQQQPTSKGSHNTICRSMVDIALPKEMDVEAYANMQPLQYVEPYRRRPSPIIYYGEKLSTRRESRRSVSPARIRRSRREPPVDSMDGIPWNNQSRRSQRVESRSPGQQRCRSPASFKEGREWIRGRYFEEDYRDIEINDRAQRGAWTKKTEYEVEHGDHSRKHSSSTDSGYGNRSSASSYHSRKDRQRSRSFSKSRSPSDSMVRQSRDEVETNERALQIVKKEDVAFLSLAMDRRTRRYKQAVLEAEKSKRKREGKKSFYLTLDSEGKPCGPGKKAWLADINKLATWLDPSCMHIRKQSYEDMCIFKDRLNENFEYSGDVNEDYLRALAGKAVTRKRTELISLIKRNGSRPSNMDDAVWKRLEKIANSKQRDERTEHGRYANACRKTMGRTGSLGVDGIRERLREMYGRSPHPHELREEMERDKGFGRKEEGRSGVLKRHGKECIEDVLEEESMHIRPNSYESKDFGSEEGHYGRRQLVPRDAIETTKSPIRVHHKGKDMVASGSGMESGIAGQLEKNKTSKDEYIARLEAELLSLKGHTPNGFGSCDILPYERTIHTRFENDGFQWGYRGETSTTTRSRPKKLQR